MGDGELRGLAITGAGSVCVGGVGLDAFAEALGRDNPQNQEALAVADALHDEEMAPPKSLAIPSFDMRAHLGRKGTSFLDRYTGLALVACKDALADAGLEIGPDNSPRIGVSLGTLTGSLKSTSDFSREAQGSENPLAVSPMLFPNTILNFAAGQAAIRFAMRGVNATVAGGELAFLHALRYARNALRNGYADIMLCGGVEECSPHSSWASHLSADPNSRLPSGEGAAVFILQPSENALREGRPAMAELIDVVLRYNPGGDRAGFVEAFAATIADTIAAAGIAASDVTIAATGDGGEEGRDQPEAAALALALGRGCEQIRVKRSFGTLGGATGALQLAALLARRRAPKPAKEIALLTNRSGGGSFGVAVFGISGCDRADRL